MAGKDRRVVLAKWLASPENPYFATSFANRVWAHFFGTGIVEPVDDVRVSNPASNPELLDELGKRFTDVEVRPQDAGPRHLQLADVSADDRSATRATRATSGTSPTPTLRRIKAENLLDAISEVTETKDKFQGLPAGRPGRADRRRRQLDLLPHHLRPRDPRDGLLVRGEDGADPLAGPPPAQRRHGQRQDPARAA